MTLWVCKDSFGTYLTTDKPIWNIETGRWVSKTAGGIRIPAKLAGIENNQSAEITGVMIDYRTLEEKR